MSFVKKVKNSIWVARSKKLPAVFERYFVYEKPPFYRIGSEWICPWCGLKGYITDNSQMKVSMCTKCKKLVVFDFKNMPELSKDKGAYLIEGYLYEDRLILTENGLEIHKRG